VYIPNLHGLHARIAFCENIYTYYYGNENTIVDVPLPPHAKCYEQYFPNLDNILIHNKKLSMNGKNNDVIAEIKFSDKINKLHIFVIKPSNQNVFKQSFIALPDYFVKYNINDLKRILELITFNDQFSRHLLNLSSHKIIHLLEISDLESIVFTMSRYKEKQNIITIDITIEFNAGSVTLRSHNINNHKTSYIKVFGNRIVANVFKRKGDIFDPGKNKYEHYFSYLNFFIHPAVIIDKIPFSMCPICIMRLFNETNTLNEILTPSIQEIINNCVTTYIVTNDKQLHTFKNKIIKDFASLKSRNKYLQRILDNINVSIDDIMKKSLRHVMNIIQTQDEKFINKIKMNMYHGMYMHALYSHILQVSSKSIKIFDENNGKLLGELITMIPVAYFPVL